MDWEIKQGDCLEILRSLPDASVDAVVTDPPYGLRFMGQRWDCSVPGMEVWEECLRVLKPGGHLLAFAGTRTQHRMCSNIDDAGFEIRDMIAWVYGQGFPKSLDVSKAIDREAGAARKVVAPDPEAARRNRNTPQFGGPSMNEYNPGYDGPLGRMAVTAPATPAAAQWEGWGTALKPAMEPITVARKPLDGTVAENVQQWGTGAINVDGGRIPGNMDGSWGYPQHTSIGFGGTDPVGHRSVEHSLGRWPANLIHDGSPEVTALFPEAKGMSGGGKHKAGSKGGLFGAIDCEHTARGDVGSAARFFYCAKANKRDRGSSNTHPTVKPTDLMRYLCRLVTPPGGLVLDPFAGSGSTGKGALLEGFRFLGIEQEPRYVEIARARLAAVEAA